MTDVIVIGGGASGLACAITLKRQNQGIKVTVLEKLNNPGKKILATGNGRCNLSNTDIDSKYYMGDEQIVDMVLGSFSGADCVDFFNSLGLITTVEDGRVYPYSMAATSVLKSLLLECNTLGVEILTDQVVTAIIEATKGFEVRTETDTFSCDKCILAIGGKASAANGTDGDGYRLLKNLGIKYEPIYPALVQINTAEKITHLIKGVRVSGDISLLSEDGKVLQSESGEIMFTDYGLSGIAAMQLSGKIAKLTAEGATSFIKLDLLPDVPGGGLARFLNDRMDLLDGDDLPVLLENALLGIFCEKLAAVICKLTFALAEDSNEVSGNMSMVASLAAAIIKNFQLTATGTKSFKDAQVTKGGVSSYELKDNSLETKKAPGLYVCGELLNVDGLCGGYNLHFAWGSGIYAAKEAAKNCSE